MKKRDKYRGELRDLDSWEDFLRENSGLPGPRANLELAFAVAEEGDVRQFLRWAKLKPSDAPTNAPEGFLAVCGTVGLGFKVASGRTTYLPMLREQANDPRWRVREAVALGLQRYGEVALEDLQNAMAEWSHGTLLEKRAAVATLCEPRLLVNPKSASRTLEMLDEITRSLLEVTDRKSDQFRVLRKGLGYGWSVAIVAAPDRGKALFEKWAGSEDPDIRWIMRENLKKKRLERMDAIWVSEQANRVKR